MSVDDRLEDDPLDEEAEPEPPPEPEPDPELVDAALQSAAENNTDETADDFAFRRAAAKVREFPRKPGVYLLKNVAGVTIYIGKAKSLRARAGSYFLQGARQEYRTAQWVHEIADADFIECDSDVDALLIESCGSRTSSPNTIGNSRMTRRSPT